MGPFARMTSGVSASKIASNSSTLGVRTKGVQHDRGGVRIDATYRMARRGGVPLDPALEVAVRKLQAGKQSG